MKKFFKKNKVFVIGILFFIIVFAVIIIALWDILIPSGGSLYGNRLNGIEEVLPSDDKIEEIVGDLESEDKVLKASFSRSGKILNFIVDVKPDTTKKVCTSYAGGILEHLTDDQISYFDIQVYFTSETEELEEDEKSIYPIIAYKHRTSTNFSTNN